jgi:predicted XRE-type DNA-binding protein
VSESFESVFDALADTPEEAANLKMRSLLMSAIKAEVRSWGVTQAVAATRLGITRPRCTDLLQGKLGKFSLDALVALASVAGLNVELRVEHRGAPGEITLHP